MRGEEERLAARLGHNAAPPATLSGPAVAQRSAARGARGSMQADCDVFIAGRPLRMARTEATHRGRSPKRRRAAETRNRRSLTPEAHRLNHNRSMAGLLAHPSPAPPSQRALRRLSGVGVSGKPGGFTGIYSSGNCCRISRHSLFSTATPWPRPGARLKP